MAFPDLSPSATIFYRDDDDDGLSEFGTFEDLTKLARTFGEVTGSSSRGNIFDDKYAEEATEKLDERAVDTLQQIRDVFANIAGLTGLSTPDAVKAYGDRFTEYMKGAYKQGREDVYGFNPRGISESAAVMKGMIDPALDQYSLLSRGGFMSQALNPDVVKVDPTSVTSVADAYYDPKQRQLYDYQNAATQSLIQGREKAIEQQADFYANNPNVKGLMTYNV